MLERVRPEYSKAFRCIGSACEDTCCQGLDVAVDKGTYQKFQAIPRLQPLANEHFERTGHSSDLQYARIRLAPGMVCPFLSAERLCVIQKEHGDQYLSETCSSYPRVMRRVDGLVERALLLSCPEAARLVLLNPQLMRREQSSSAGQARYRELAQLPDQPAGRSVAPHRYLWEVRAFTLGLLGDRTYPLWQRLFLLGMFCARLNEIISARQTAPLPRLLRDYAQLAASGALRGEMARIPQQTPTQLAVVLEIVRRHLGTTAAGHQRFRDCVQDFLRGIGYQPGSTLESCTLPYADARTRYYQPFMEEHPFLLENYLVNQLFKTRFPFAVDSQGKAVDPMAGFVAICLQYAVIRGLLIGMAGCHRESFAAEHVVKLIQSFAKAFEHGPQIIEESVPSLANANGIGVLLCG